MSFSAIIVAGGNSSRMGGKNKQFIEIDGKTVLLHNIIKFDKIDDIDEIVVVTKKEFFENINQDITKHNITKKIVLCEGGDTRQQSVLNGFSNCSDKTEYILIHDGARPLVEVDDVKKVMENTKIHKASTLAVPTKDTIKIVNQDGFIVDTPNREFVYIIQTPQVFSKDVYAKGIEKAREEGKDFTDDCQLVENIGVKVFVTVGSYTNIKITTPEDEKIAKVLLEK